MKALKLKMSYGAALFLGLIMSSQIAFAQMHCANFNSRVSIYFNSDMALVDEIGLTIIDQLVQNLTDSLKQCNIKEVKVTGYTDTHGSDQKNQALSMAMAFSIRDYLIKSEIPEEKIRVDGKGENYDYLVKFTRDGVRDPLNRRVEVEIILSKN